ncbi:MAG TPA: MarR family transcriptional regulator [Solirubrobacteraceae bacterium]|nr:MarR family transcriptional regulator [Solirubrobacteraceae bacterium]
MDLIGDSGAGGFVAREAVAEVRSAAGGAGSAVEEEFLVSFETLAQAVRRARGAAPQDRPGRLTLSQYSLLLPLCTSETARVSDLALEAGIAPSTATRILDALERREIVQRARSEHDRRGVTVTLTATGRALLSRQDAWMRARRLDFFSGLPDGERALVSDLLVRLAALIDDLGAGPPDGA